MGRVYPAGDLVGWDRSAGRSAGIDRRKFLRGLGVLGAAALVPEFALSRQAPATKPYRIDTHYHFSSPGFIAAIKERHTGQIPLMNWTPSKAIEDMDRNGVATSIVSTSEPNVWFGDDAAARKLARECNDFGAKIMSDYPGRFGMFVTLPLPDVDGALKEIEYGLDTLKADGVCFMSSYQGQYLGDPKFTPIMEELNRRKAIAYTHPFRAECCQTILPNGWGLGIELSTDTTRTIASMLFSGAVAKFPDIRFIWSHGGGSVPSLIGRLGGASKVLPNGLMPELQKFYYDTAQFYTAPPLAGLTRMVPNSQILFGTDYPFTQAEVVAKGLREYGFSPSDLHAIERDNALALFPKYKNV
ncbi:MAG TPA: amidohydrolase family protein [Candidatus Acidoferrales bacterium]|jgi:predicted TIM-barrel fold metal-dependent hydrolase|nr:amidohydrolase family protein [Candidatus Acidoferrales bacterium]